MAFPHSRATPDASAAEYRRLQARIGTRRAVVVQPAAYGTDNRVTVAAIGELGAGNTRGIAVLHPDVADGELAALDRAGVRGLRFTVGNPQTAVVSIDMIEPLAKRIADRGWHVQLNMEADEIADHADMLKRLPTPIVFDHLGKLPPEQGIKHPAYALIRGLLDQGKAWLKLSGAYMNTLVGPPAYPDATAVAQAYVVAAPDRLVWGSDWPHPTPVMPPDDAILFDLLAAWAPDERVRQRILVDNPQKLYGFPS